MVDISMFGYNAGGLISSLNSFSQFLLYAGITLAVGALLWGCMYLMSFDTLVTIRQQTASGNVILHTKARQCKSKDGIPKWRLLKYINKLHTPPPVNFLELTHKGKFNAEADRSLDGTITWRRRSDKPSDPDQFTSEERLVSFIELRRYEEMKKQKTLDKILAMAPMLLCIIIVVIVFAFWGNFVDSTSKAADAVAAGSERMAVASERLAAILEAEHGYQASNSTGYVGSVPPPGKIPN